MIDLATLGGLLEPIGHVPHAKYGQDCHRLNEAPRRPARPSQPDSA
jgi:hypothetical protein